MQESIGDMSTRMTVQIKREKVNYKRLFFTSFIIILTWCILVLGYTLYIRKSPIFSETQSYIVEISPKATVIPTIEFNKYSDDYIEFEYPQGADILVDKQKIFHPYEMGKSIDGITYLSINYNNLKIEAWNNMLGGEFETDTYNVQKKTLVHTPIAYQPNFGQGNIENQLNEEPVIEEIPTLNAYFVYIKELNKLLLMQKNEEGNYMNMNNGIWVDLDFLGKFKGDSNYANFINISCKVQKEEDALACKETLLRFLSSVKKKFSENEKYEKPKLEAKLQLREPQTLNLLGEYNFSLDSDDINTYINSSWGSFAIINEDTKLSINKFIPLFPFVDISFSKFYSTPPTFDIGSTPLFSNLIKGEEYPDAGVKATKRFEYRMYYPDPDKTQCYTLGKELHENLDDYTGCSSYYLKLKGIDAQVAASCIYNADKPESKLMCDKWITNLRVEKL